MDPQIKELLGTVERYMLPLIGNTPSGFSKQENKVLALQNINRLNISLGKMARSTKDESGNLHLLQIYVNNLTVALKNDNVPMMKSSISSARNVIKDLEQDSSP